MSDFVIGLKHYNGVNAVCRKFRVVGIAQYCTDLRQMLAFGAILYRIDSLRIDIFGEDYAVEADSLGSSDCQPAAASTDIRDRRSGVNTEKRKDALGLEPRVAFRIFENRQIAFIWRACWAGWCRVRCGLSLEDYGGDGQQESAEESGILPHRKACDMKKITVKAMVRANGGGLAT